MKKTKVIKSKDKKAVLTVSQDDYHKQRAGGVDEEFILKPGQHVFRRVRQVATRDEVQLRNCKVRITMYLDGDVLEYFKRRASRPHAAPYQTQINETLREVMNRETVQSSRAVGVGELLDNPEFIDAVAERVQQRTSKRRRTA
jgi:uncharacterized protein (DUF4415 family)